MFLFAADLLEEGQQHEVRAHVATGCPRCTGALAEAEAALSLIPASIDPVNPPPAAKDRLMARVASSAATRSRTSRAGWGIALAACIGLVVGAAALHFYENSIHKRELADAHEQLKQVRGTLESKQLQLVSLSAAQPQSTAWGRVAWDRDHGKWHVMVFDLKPPPAGRTYELWFITPDQKKIPAGTFMTDASGRGEYDVNVPADIGPIALAAITDEPGLVQSPTGAIHLAGKVE